MKKLLFLFLASFLVLAACGNEEESKLDDTKETKSKDKESKKDDKDSDKGSNEEKDKSDEKQKSDDKSSEEVATQDESTEEAQSQEQVNTQEQQSTQQPAQSQQQTQQAPVQSQEQSQQTPAQSQEQDPVEQPTQEIQGGNDAGAAEEQQAFLRESDPEYYEQFEEKTGDDLPEGPNGHYGITPTSEYSYSNDQLGPDGLPREDAVATDENGNPEPQ